MALVPYHDRDGFIWMNGKLVPWRQANLHVLSHGLHYASAVFEGERAYNGEIFKLSEHSQRLIDSGRLLDFEIPYSVAEIDEACRATMRANKLTDCYVRPIAWRGSELMGVTTQVDGKNVARINLSIAVWEWGSYFDAATKMKGIRIALAEYRRPDPRTIPVKAKATGLYMICTLEKHRAERAGYADAMMLDWRGYVSECTGANIFFIKDGAIHTPNPDCFLDGITRRTVIDLAKRRKLKVTARRIKPAELESFTECFIVGTAAEVTPVAEIGPYRFKPGKITETLMNDYNAMVRQQMPALEPKVEKIAKAKVKAVAAAATKISLKNSPKQASRPR